MNQADLAQAIADVRRQERQRILNALPPECRAKLPNISGGNGPPPLPDEAAELDPALVRAVIRCLIGKGRHKA